MNRKIGIVTPDEFLSGTLISCLKSLHLAYDFSAEASADPSALDGYDVLVVEDREGFDPASVRQPFLLLSNDPKKDLPSRGTLVLLPFKASHLAQKIVETCRAELPADIALGRFILNPAERILTDSMTNEDIRLTEKEVGILMILSSGGLIAKEILLEKAFEYGRDISTHTLETHIYRLRQKTERDGVLFILNEDGGYRLNM